MKRPARPSRKRTAKGRSPERDQRGGRAGLRHTLIRWIVVVGLSASCAGLLIAAMVLFQYDRLAAGYDITAVGRMPMETSVLDATGEWIGYLHGEVVGLPVTLDEVSPFFLEALIAREDSRFHRHAGIDRRSLVRAWLRNAKEKRTVQGASTLTMQLTRMAYALSGKTMRRKLLEMALARRIEKHFSKDEILSLYVNRIFLGTGMNGIEQAAQGYFGKPASDLSLPEAAMIAGVIRAPNGFSPFRNYEAALREMRSTLRRMEDEGMISREELAALESVRPTVLPQERWMDMLRKQAKISEQNYLLKMVGDRVEEMFPSLAGVGGLTVRTTFDVRLQAAAERAVADHLGALESQPGYPHAAYSGYGGGEPEYLQAASVVLENFTGAMRAVVGGRNFSHSAFNRATQARRPMGSIFKPLVYGTAFERGIFPGMQVSDGPISEGEIAWDRIGWSPENSDGVFGGMLPVETGLIKSRNTMTVRVGEWAGIQNVLAMMEHAGLGSFERGEPTPPIYIGTVGADVRDVTSAYSVFATGGVRHEPFFIDSVTDRDGNTLYRHADANYRVLSSGATWLTSNILKKVMEEGGTGEGVRNLGFRAPAGGKTGTTNDFHDAWFVGYTSRLSCGVWIGMDQPRTIMPGAYGGRIALPVWSDIMTEAESIGYEFTDFADPEEVISMELCKRTGRLAGEKCLREGTVYVEEVPHDLIPRKFCNSHE